jgi:hypothetical protein
MKNYSILFSLFLASQLALNANAEIVTIDSHQDLIQNIAITASGGVFGLGADGIIYQTADQGKNWIAFSNHAGITSFGVSLIGEIYTVSAITDEDGVLKSSRIEKTVDGIVWTRIIGRSDGAVNSVAVAPNGQAYFSDGQNVGDIQDSYIFWPDPRVVNPIKNFRTSASLRFCGAKVNSGIYCYQFNRLVNHGPLSTVFYEGHYCAAAIALDGSQDYGVGSDGKVYSLSFDSTGKTVNTLISGADAPFYSDIIAGTYGKLYALTSTPPLSLKKSRSN